MELLTYKDGTVEYTYYKDKFGATILHGMIISRYSNGSLHSMYYCSNSKKHGEYKWFYRDGGLIEHVFFIHDQRYPYVEMNEQEKLLFQIQHPGFQFLS